MHFEKIMNTLYSFAAAVVIFGAWAKLEHRDYGSEALTAGLLTEVGIFFIYGLIEWRKTPESPGQSASLPATAPPVNSLPPLGDKMEELTGTLKQTNRILNKVFKAE